MDSNWYTVVWWGSLPKWMENKYHRRTTQSEAKAQAWLRDIERNASGFAHNARIVCCPDRRQARLACISGEVSDG